ncbi:UNVERIFIED_CONTAM: hypothetical protein HDU68_003267, partial [Siphonaria sp. JEL0065]
QQKDGGDDAATKEPAVGDSDGIKRVTTATTLVNAQPPSSIVTKEAPSKWNFQKMGSWFGKVANSKLK